MDSNLEKLFKKINFPEELQGEFNDAKLEHISRKRDNSKCLFTINLARSVSYKTYL